MATDRRAASIVVSGMHRSGTSFLASLLHGPAARMGDTLLAADCRNRKGYFEDVEFLDLNRRILRAAVPADTPGHPDWGWSEGHPNGPFESEVLGRFEPEADALVSKRRMAGIPWGWKDPRTSLLLDFWDARVPEARHVFIYRFPWEVADSMQRVGAEVFLRRPDFAYRIWLRYNRALLAFASRHRERVLVVSAAAVMRAPHRVSDLLRARFAIDIGPPSKSDRTLFLDRGTADPLASLAAAVHADCAETLRELEALADLPSGETHPRTLTAPATPGPSTAAVAVIIPCCDQGEFLLDAVASVERVLHVPYELIIVNDGSRESGTIAILSALRAAGYRVIDQENQGLAKARNRGIEDASAPAFLPLDADNRLCPGFVEAALERLRREPQAAAVYGDRVEFGMRSGRIQVGVPDLNRLLCGNYIDACAVIRTDACRACGGYDAKMPAPGGEDWDLWLALLSRDLVLVRLDLPAFDYRVRPDSMLSRYGIPSVLESTERYVLAKHAPLYLNHLRRQVDRLEASAAALDEAQAQLAELRASLPT